LLRDENFFKFISKKFKKFRNVNGIIFVVDASDKLRIAVARDELWMLLDHKDLTYKKVYKIY